MKQVERVTNLFSFENPQGKRLPDVAIVGFSVRAIAQSAVRAGLLPWSCDAFADRDLRACGPTEICADYPRGFETLLAAAKLPRDTPLVYGGGLENHPGVVEQLSRLHPLWGNSAESLACRDCDFFPTPNVASRSRNSVLNSSAFGNVVRAFVKKPRSGAGGVGVSLVMSHDVPSIDDPPQGYRFQPYVSGPSFGALFVMGAGRAWLWGVTRQRVGRSGDGMGFSHDFSYAGSIGPWPVSPAWRRQLRELGAMFARRFLLRGLCGVDFIGGARPWPIEINPRWTASAEILERATGCSAWRLHAIGSTAACPDEFEERIAIELKNSRGILNWSSHAPGGGRSDEWFGKAIWYATRATPVAAALLDSLDRIGVHDPLSSSRRAVEVADVPISGQVIPAETPICTVFAAGSTPSSVEHQLRETVASLRRANLNGG